MAWKLKKRLRFFIFLIVANVLRFWKWLKKKLWVKKKFKPVPSTPRRTFTEEEDDVKLVTPRSGDFKKSGDAVLINIDELMKKGGLHIPSHVIKNPPRPRANTAPVQVIVTPPEEEHAAKTPE